MAKKWVDAHGHFATPGKSSGRAPGLAATARPWTFAPETSIDYMDKTGVAAGASGIACDLDQSRAGDITGTASTSLASK